MFDSVISLTPPRHISGDHLVPNRGLSQRPRRRVEVSGAVGPSVRESILHGGYRTDPYATGAFGDPLPVYNPYSRRWVVLRHSLSIAMTTAFITIAFMVVSLPIVAVFFIDGDLIASDYAEAVLLATGAGLVVSMAIFPFAFGFERLVMRGGRVWKVLAACAPMAFPIVAALIFVSALKTPPSAAAGKVLSGAIWFSVSFSVYWLSLWSLNAVRYGAWRLAVRMKRGRRFG